MDPFAAVSVEMPLSTDASTPSSLATSRDQLINDDLKREFTFHQMALAAVQAFRSAVIAAKKPFFKPDDYQGIYLKTADQMDKMASLDAAKEQAQRQAEQAKKQRLAKKFGKQIQQQKEQLKQQKKKESLAQIEAYKLKKKQNASKGGFTQEDDDDAFNISLTPGDDKRTGNKNNGKNGRNNSNKKPFSRPSNNGFKGKISKGGKSNKFNKGGKPKRKWKRNQRTK